MLNLSTTYPGNVDITQPATYPWGKPRNITSPGATDGTPWEAEGASDLLGWLQALLSRAGMTPNGVTERVGASQVLTALDTIFSTVAQRTSDIRGRQLSNLLGAIASIRGASSVVPSGENVLATGLVTTATPIANAALPSARELPFALIRNAAGNVYVQQIGVGTQLGSASASTVTSYSSAAILPVYVGANTSPVVPYVIAGTVGGTLRVYVGKSNTTTLTQIHASPTVLLGAGYKMGAGYIVATADATTVYVHYSADLSTWTTRSIAHGLASSPIAMPPCLVGTVSSEAQQGTTSDASLFASDGDGIWCCIFKHLTTKLVGRVMLAADNTTVSVATADPSTIGGILIGAIASKDPCFDGMTGTPNPVHYAVVSDGTNIAICPTLHTSSFSTDGAWSYVATGLAANSVASVGITIHEGRRIALVTTRDGQTLGYEYGNQTPVFYGVSGCDNMRTYQSACRSSYGFVGTDTVGSTVTLYAICDSRLRNDYAHGAAY